MTGTQHVGQLAHLLCICDGLVKRLGKVVAYQDRKVGILTLQILKAVSIYNCQIVIIILLCYKSARILDIRSAFLHKEPC